MSYIIDRVLIDPTRIEIPSSAGDPIDLWLNVSLPATSLRDLVVYIHNPEVAVVDVLIAIVKPETVVTSYTLNSSEGLVIKVAPGDTLPIGIRRGAGNIFLAGDGATSEISVGIEAVTGVQAC
jgi:hypothetical protein